ncbi:MAG: hypothetical protein V1904_09510 [Bacteroidota bacterium]
MDKVSIILPSLEFKLKKIVDLQQQTIKENEKLKKDHSESNKIIEEQKVIIKNLEEKIKVLKISKSIEGKNDNYRVKLRINELLREIDKCIALLNK